MFDSLSDKFEKTLRKLRGRGRLTAAEIDEVVAEIRQALLEADVNFQVVKQFCESIRTKASNLDLQKNLTPGQTVIKYVYDELVSLLGEHSPVNLKQAPPVIIMMVGLQGSGKTTSCGKLAALFKQEHKRKPLLVSLDIYRPAAIEQLKTVGAGIGVDVFNTDPNKSPAHTAVEAVTLAKNSAKDVVILDTAGRLQIDEALMNELVEVVEAVDPNEVIFVADAMTGQEAVNVAKGFNDRLEIDGIILTKLDGDARGGAALSVKSVIGKPIKYVGVGEKSDALELFYPDRMASRILGMGDVLTLIEKASKQIDEQQAKDIQKKFKKNEFTFDDFYQQLQSVKKMGSISSLAGMIPGMGQLTKQIDEETIDREMRRTEAIILSMTKKEREDDSLINGSRRKRIAAGAGTTVEEVNKLLQQFSMMKKMMSKLAKGGAAGMMRNLGSLQGMMGGGGPPGGIRR
jgi:signal recognition particle subunit SRP54